MKLSLKEITLITLAITVMISSSFNYSYGQSIQDLSCSGCVQIENSDRLEIHKFLELPIILWSEDFMYTFDHSSKIVINGHSKLNNPDVPIVFTVSNPIGNIVTIDQIMVKPNSDFKVEFNPTGPLWKQDGMYIIKAQAGPQSTVFKVNVKLISMDSLSSFECDSNEITVSGDNGGQYCIPFKAEFPNTQMSGFLSTETKTLVLTVRSNSAQILEIDIDRKLLNAKSSDGEDAEFIVMINGEPTDFDEKESQLAGHRTITVSYGAGEKTIEIIGTSVIPEFGSIAVLILFVSIITVVAISRKKILLANNFSKF
jgi:predicted secreted protein with PEFG-CTERM motif